jgi:hypothetical protein
MRSSISARITFLTEDSSGQNSGDEMVPNTVDLVLFDRVDGFCARNWNKDEEKELHWTSIEADGQNARTV